MLRSSTRCNPRICVYRQSGISVTSLFLSRSSLVSGYHYCYSNHRNTSSISTSISTSTSTTRKNSKSHVNIEQNRHGNKNNIHYRSNTPQHFRNNPVSQRDSIKSFFTKNHTNTKELDIYLEEKFPTMHVPDTAQLLYSAALNNHVLTGKQLDMVIHILQSYINDNQPKLFHKYFYNPVHFSRLMYGLKTLHPQNRDINIQLSRLLITLNDMLQLRDTNTFQNKNMISSCGSNNSGNNNCNNNNGNHNNHNTMKNIHGINNRSSDSNSNSNSKLFDARSFSMCIFGLQNMRIEHATNGPVLLELISKFREIVLHLNDLDPYSLSFMIHGVKSLDTTNPVIQEFLSIMINKAVHLKDESFTYQLICNNIGGLVKHHNLASHESLSLLHILTEKLQNCKKHHNMLDANLMGVYFVHLQDLIRPSSSPSEEVFHFISALTDSVEDSSHTPSPSQIANMLYASKNMPQDHQVVRRMQKIILDKSENVIGNFTPRDISKCMVSLKYINIFETERLVPLLTKWFKRGLRNKKQLNTKDFQSCLYGLRHVKCTSNEVRELIHVFSNYLKDSKLKTSSSLSSSSSRPLNASSVVHAFHFLRSVDCAYPEVQLFIKELNNKIQNSNIKIDERQVNIIYGLSHIKNPYPAIRPIIAMLSECLAPLPPLLPRVGYGFLIGLSGLHSQYPETRSLLTLVLNDLEKNSFKLHHTHDIGLSLKSAFSVIQNMSIEEDIVRKYLIFLTREMETMLLMNCPDSSQSDSYGKSDDGVNILSTTTTTSTSESTSASISISADVISDCLASLKHMNTEYPEVKAIVNVLMRCCRDHDRDHDRDRD